MADDKKKTTVFYGWPENDSFEAFVEFMDAMADALGVEKTLTEEQKRKYYEQAQEKKGARS